MDSPIVIIGAARSGTKFLRDVLSASAEIRAVPYDINYVWRFGANNTVDDRLDPATLTDARRRFIRKTLKSLSGADDDHRVIEKTVSNTLRVPYVYEILPEARFLHLIRDGRAVTESAIRQWRKPPDWAALARKLRDLPIRSAGYAVWFARNSVAGLIAGRGGGGVWGPRYPGIENDLARHDLIEVCALQWLHSVETARRDLADLPSERVFEVRYEDLVTSEAVVQELASYLGLRDRHMILDAYRSDLRAPAMEPWRKLTVDAQARMLALIEPTLDRLGYI